MVLPSAPFHKLAQVAGSLVGSGGDTSVEVCLCV